MFYVILDVFFTKSAQYFVYKRTEYLTLRHSWYYVILDVLFTINFRQ